MRQTLNKQREENQLEIALGDLIFICKTEQNDDECLFCVGIIENQSNWIDNIQIDGIEINHRFVITTKGYKAKNRATDILFLKQELNARFKETEIQAKRKEIDRQAIKSEEALLEAERKWLVSKKRTQKAKMLEVKRGDNMLVFEIINE
ncbi:hypothetical protein [Helicobacter apodemus]|uniref:Uncharacterized protein n=1 Tax=Helicobacter apodemus TaxID=135569 RepID=A0A2U8FD73_9HELI|nr:hypothetical protein [Helicobacter apodemus]AWI34104.1 hypothetical protein CDV25_04445 [Helicobacter apodemus]